MLTQQLPTPGTRRTRTHQKHQDKSSPSLISQLNMVEVISVRPRTHTDVVRPPYIWLLDQVSLALWLLQTTPPPAFHCTRTLNHQYSGFPDVSQLFIKPIILHMNNTDWLTASPGKLSPQSNHTAHVSCLLSREVSDNHEYHQADSGGRAGSSACLDSVDEVKQYKSISSPFALFLSSSNVFKH